MGMPRIRAGLVVVCFALAHRTMRSTRQRFALRAISNALDRTGGVMWRGAAVVIATLLLAGCASGEGSTDVARDSGAGPSSSVDASLGVDVSPDNPALERVDAAGRLPEESVLALIDALNASDWDTAYSLYATPNVDPATAAREWADAHETHVDFKVHEVRVIDSDMAWVRVTYGVVDDPSSSALPPLIVGEPGEGWTLFKVDGVWKTRWMPRQ